MPPSPERSRASFPVIIHHEEEAHQDIVQESAISDEQRQHDGSQPPSRAPASVDKLHLINAWLTHMSEDSRDSRTIAQILDNGPKRRSPLPEIRITDPEAAKQIDQSLREQEQEPVEPVRSDICELTQHTGSHFTEQELELPDEMELDIDEAVEYGASAKDSHDAHSEPPHDA